MGFSAIVSVLFAGMTMKHYTHRNISRESRGLSIFVFKLVAHLAESTVFLVLGLSVSLGGGTCAHTTMLELERDLLIHATPTQTFAVSGSFSLGLSIYALAALILSRAANVYPLSMLHNFLKGGVFCGPGWALGEEDANAGGGGQTKRLADGQSAEEQ